MVRIANPTYDVVFKYLLEDNRIAKLLIGDLLQTEILDLELQPQEYATKPERVSLTVYRIDFKAKIRTREGKTQVVLIEIQKAKFASDIMRFRKYLGEQYSSESNYMTEEGKIKALPLIAVYFLGYTLPELPDIPIIRIVRKYLNGSTNEYLNVRSEFVESLTHDSIVVQLPALKKKRLKNDLEQALSIFDPAMKHILELDESRYPVRYGEVIRRLQKAIAEREIVKTMEIEDEILYDLEQKERAIESLQEKVEEKMKELAEVKEKEAEARRQAEQERKEKEEARRRQEEAQKREEEARKQADEIKQRLAKTAKIMKSQGIDIETIKQATGLSDQEIKKL